MHTKQIVSGRTADEEDAASKPSGSMGMVPATLPSAPPIIEAQKPPLLSDKWIKENLSDEALAKKLCITKRKMTWGKVNPRTHMCLGCSSGEHVCTDHTCQCPTPNCESRRARGGD